MPETPSADPSPDASSLTTAAHLDDAAAAQLREAQLDQLQYLVDEVEALKAVIGKVPEALQRDKPMGTELSLRELYGVLAQADEETHVPLVERMMATDTPTITPTNDEARAAEADWNDTPMRTILAEVQRARTALVETLHALPATDWTRTVSLSGTTRDVYGLAHVIIQRDADLLRTAGYRLHESHLTDRDEDLPK